MRLKLLPPTKPFYITQKFGYSEACSEVSDLPISKRKVVAKKNGVCPVGFEELYPLLGMKGHTGLDIYAKRGMPIYASEDGFVHEVSLELERGLGLDVVTHGRYDMNEHGVHYAKYRNWHLLSVSVVLGQSVKKGDILGYADSTGLSSGDHDHFELKPVEKDLSGNWYNVYQYNGYFGNIDPEPFIDLEAEQIEKLTLQIAIIKVQIAIWKILKGR